MLPSMGNVKASASLEDPLCSSHLQLVLSPTGELSPGIALIGGFYPTLTAHNLSRNAIESPDARSQHYQDPTLLACADTYLRDFRAGKVRNWKGKTERL